MMIAYSVTCGTHQRWLTCKVFNHTGLRTVYAYMYVHRFLFCYQVPSLQTELHEHVCVWLSYIHYLRLSSSHSGDGVVCKQHHLLLLLINRCTQEHINIASEFNIRTYIHMYYVYVRSTVLFTEFTDIIKLN